MFVGRTTKILRQGETTPYTVISLNEGDVSTRSNPEQTIEQEDAKLGRVRIRLWTRKHFRLSPHYPMSIILVERLLEDGSPRVNKPMWLAFVGEEMPPLSQLWKLYLRRFAVDHWYRFIKQRLHWTLPKLATPQQCDRWSDLMPLMTWELWLARDIVNCLSPPLAETDGCAYSRTGCTSDAWDFGEGFYSC